MRIIITNDKAIWYVHAHKPVHLAVLRSLNMPAPLPLGVRPLNRMELIKIRNQLRTQQ